LHFRYESVPQREGGLRDARASALRFLETLSSSLDARTENEYVERCVRDSIGQLKVSLAVDLAGALPCRLFDSR
jgi:hypothetical protein